MKRRRVSVCGKATFLPTLPSGNLGEWILIHASKPEGSNCSLAYSSSSTALEIGSEPPGRVGTGRRPDMPLLRSDIGCRACHSRINYDFLDDPTRVDEAMAGFRKDIYAVTSRNPSSIGSGMEICLTPYLSRRNLWRESRACLKLVVTNRSRTTCLASRNIMWIRVFSGHSR